MADKPTPGNGFFGWLGRQVGHVKKAVRTDVEKPPEPEVASQVIYQKETVQEAPHPRNPDVTLRRTVIDEVVVDKKTLDDKESKR